MPAVVLVDSGTTATRVRLWDGQALVATSSEAVGARNTAIDGHPGQVEAALRRLIQKVVCETGRTPEAVLCAGMITSNVGLVEVPHLSAPAGLPELVRGLVAQEFPEIYPAPFLFIPGVKTVPDPLNGDTLAKADLLRGEEVEIVGLRELMALNGPAYFMHYGSHHKAITVDAAGRILGSRTSMTGEILAAVMQNTVLKSSVLPLDQVDPDPAMWQTGLAHAEAEGVGRALFLTRVVDQLWHRSKEEATSFLLGVLTSLDLPLISDALAHGADVVLYGKGHFPHILQQYLKGSASRSRVQLVDERTADLSSALGSVRIYEQWVAHR